MANRSEDINSTSTAIQASSIPAGIPVFLSALNICLSITASLGNALILIALRKVSSVHPPTKLLFRNLAVTDLCVGIIVQPLFAAYIILDYFSKIDVRQVQGEISFILSGVSIFTSTAISMDRLLALRLKMRYRHVLTLKRVRVVISCTWLSSIKGLVMLHILDSRITFTLAVCVIFLCGGISIFCYTKIFLRLRQHQTQVQDHAVQQANTGGIPLNIARYKNTVSSMAWVQFVLVASLVSVIICIIITEINGTDARILRICTLTLFYSTSSLNPLLYCWKIGEVRQAVKNTARQFQCCLSC